MLDISSSSPDRFPGRILDGDYEPLDDGPSMTQSELREYEVHGTLANQRSYSGEMYGPVDVRLLPRDNVAFDDVPDTIVDALLDAMEEGKTVVVHSVTPTPGLAVFDGLMEERRRRQTGEPRRLAAPRQPITAPGYCAPVPIR